MTQTSGPPHSHPRASVALCFVLLVAHAVSARGADFRSEILPLFERSCFRCHTGRITESGLRLDSREEALRGGESGIPLLVPGDPDESHLIQVIRGESAEIGLMPPKGEPLSEPEIELIARWVKEGAEWPDIAPDERVHWAYRKPQRPPIPSPTRSEWVRNPIDAFILARLESEGLSPSPEADRATLIRRLSLDLTGLPPSPEEADLFILDHSPGAWDRAVARLLDSPAYGERQAQAWLDLARYADSNGFEKDNARSVWPWRDWVINALNVDIPFDEFAIAQMAGDMLPGATLDQRVATGFHRNAMSNEEGGVDPEETRVAVIHDQIETTWTAFLGTTMSCARCHDHKHDPFSDEEYYSFFAILNNQRPTLDVVNTHSQLTGGAKAQVPTASQRELVAARDRRIRELNAESARSGPLERARTLERIWELSVIGPTDIPTTLVMEEMPEPRETFVHMKGDFRVAGERVTPGVPEVLPPLPPRETPDRLAFARWLVDGENPLTARVFVNRVWQQYFGIGIVRTTEDFGTQGERPVHPELLDWLALTFQSEGWSIKNLHRLIVTSSTYRQTSRVTPALLERDPENRLLARGPRFRLQAEQIRDQALTAAGILTRTVGGPSVFPYQPPGVWRMPYSARKWKDDTGADRYRRGIYTWWQRTAPFPSFLAFDAPSREAVCPHRTRTNTPLQALVTLNDPAFMEAARGLARRVIRECEGDTAERIDYAFRLCLVRAPEPAESLRLMEYYRRQIASFSLRRDAAREVLSNGVLPPVDPWIDDAELAAWTMVANVLLNLDETLTRG